MRCDTTDNQTGRTVQAIELGPKWKEPLPVIISVKDGVVRIKQGRKKTQVKLRRLDTAGVNAGNDYRRPKGIRSLSWTERRSSQTGHHNQPMCRSARTSDPSCKTSP